jgi:post-segregation antitoxin (ccd killing protein)
MPRMQVYLPDEMYASVTARHLRVSELLQQAIVAELRRQDLLAETDRYLARLIAQVGEPTASERAHADALARKVARRRVRRAG